MFPFFIFFSTYFFSCLCLFSFLSVIYPLFLHLHTSSLLFHPPSFHFPSKSIQPYPFVLHSSLVQYQWKTFSLMVSRKSFRHTNPNLLLHLERYYRRRGRLCLRQQIFTTSALTKLCKTNRTTCSSMEYHQWRRKLDGFEQLLWRISSRPLSRASWHTQGLWERSECKALCPSLVSCESVIES